jgi:hypothetical protein
MKIQGVYTEEQKARFAKLWTDGVTYADIAERMGWNLNQCKYLRLALGLPGRLNGRPGSKFWTDHRDEVLRRMWADNRSAMAIADAIGALPDRSESVRRQKIYQRAKQLRLATRGKDFGKNRGWTEAKIKEACDMCAAGHSINNIALALNRSPGVVERILEKRGMIHQVETEPKRERGPVFAEGSILLPQRASATPVPDVEAWQAQRAALRERLERDGGSVSRLI